MTKVSVCPQRAKKVTSPHKSRFPPGDFPQTGPLRSRCAQQTKMPASRAQSEPTDAPARKHLVVVEGAWLYPLKIPQRTRKAPPGSSPAPALAA